MDKITIFIWLVFVHFIADWLFQSQYDSDNKSKNWKSLIRHSTIYTITFLFPFLYLHINLWWLIAVFIWHMILDRRRILLWIMNIKGMTLQNNPEYAFAIVKVVLDQTFHLLLLWIIINIK